MKVRRLSALLLAFFLLLPQSGFALASEKCAVCQKLLQAGFSPSYLSPLCALSLSHPEWEFVPLKVTELSYEKGENYTFDRVLEEEYGFAGRSLVSAKEVFKPYWDQNKKVYDRGFYGASREAVAYFLDPRNFLSEEEIFQFLLLSHSGKETKEQVLRVLGNSAAREVFPNLEERLIDLGEQWKLSPLFLATRLRQEQGSEGNPLLFGTAGEVVGKKFLSGFYNIFNMGAFGQGKMVYESGAEYARQQGWDSPEKALEGGVQILSEEYVLRHQDTLYLQKWNVDPRSVTKEGESRNFWAQFMQNIGAAKTEGDFLYEVLKDEESLCFLIPVYENMPESISPDPAQGSCLVFATVKTQDSPHFYPEVQVVAGTKPGEEKTQEKEKSRKIFFQKSVLFLFPVMAFGAVLLLREGRKKSGKSSFFVKSSKKI